MESGGLLPENQQRIVGLHLLAAALADMTIANRQYSTSTKSKIENEIDPYSPWKAATGFRMAGNNRLSLE